jgi:hypothetical protein
VQERRRTGGGLPATWPAYSGMSQAQYSYTIGKARSLLVAVGVALPKDDEVEESEDEERCVVHCLIPPRLNLKISRVDHNKLKLTTN